jgi:hypothetical protein
MPIEASISRILIYCAAASIMAPGFPPGPSALAEQLRPPCHPSPNVAATQATFAARNDIVYRPRVPVDACRPTLTGRDWDDR